MKKMLGRAKQKFTASAAKFPEEQDPEEQDPEEQDPEHQWRGQK